MKIDCVKSYNDSQPILKNKRENNCCGTKSTPSLLKQNGKSDSVSFGVKTPPKLVKGVLGKDELPFDFMEKIRVACANITSVVNGK